MVWDKPWSPLSVRRYEGAGPATEPTVNRHTVGVGPATEPTVNMCTAGVGLDADFVSAHTRRPKETHSSWVLSLWWTGPRQEYSAVLP